MNVNMCISIGGYGFYGKGLMYVHIGENKHEKKTLLYVTQTRIADAQGRLFVVVVHRNFAQGETWSKQGKWYIIDPVIKTCEQKGQFDEKLCTVEEGERIGEFEDSTLRPFPFVN